MAELATHSPLARFAPGPERAMWRCEGLGIEELPREGIVRLQLLADDPIVRATLARVCGLALPEPGMLASAAELRCAWVARGEWLFLCPNGDEYRLVAGLESAAPGNALATAITHGRIRIGLQGPPAWRVLAKDCGLDLHPLAFGPGRCTITRYARVPVMLARPSEAPDFELWTDRAQAVHLWKFLLDAAREFAVQ